MSTENNPFGHASSTEPTRPAPVTKSGWTRLVEALVVLGIIVVLVALLLPATRSARGPARRTQCKNNLKQIGLALHNYHDAYGAFPPAVIADANGRPLHSWRTLILPFMDAGKLYESIDFSKPWDDPANAAAYEDCPHFYRCPSADLPGNHTSYVALAGDDNFLRPRFSRRIAEITDGTSNTIAVVEVPRDRSVHWMAPEDFGVDVVLHTVPEIETTHRGGYQALLGDGSVRFFSSQMDVDTRSALVTVAGGETPGEF